MRSVSAFLGHANVTTTARYVNMKDDYLQECIEWKLLALRFVAAMPAKGLPDGCGALSESWVHRP